MSETSSTTSHKKVLNKSNSTIMSTSKHAPSTGNSRLDGAHGLSKKSMESLASFANRRVYQAKGTGPSNILTGFSANLAPVWTRELDKIIFSAKFSPNGAYSAAGLDDGTVAVISNENQEVINRLVLKENTENMPATAITFRPINPVYKDQSVLAVSYANGMVAHWHYTAGKQLNVVHEEGNQINCVVYDNSGFQYGTAGSDCYIRVYDARKHVLKFKAIHGSSEITTGHSNRVFALKFHPKDPNLVMTSGWDNTIQIWDTRKPVSIKSIYGPHVCGESIDFDPSGQLIVAGSYAKSDTIQVFSWESGKLMETIEWSKNRNTAKYCPLYSLKVLPGISGSGENGLNETLIFCGGGAGTGSNEVRVYGLESKKCLASIQNISGTVNSVDAIAGNPVFIYGGAHKSLHCMELKYGLADE